MKINSPVLRSRLHPSRNRVRSHRPSLSQSRKVDNLRPVIGNLPLRIPQRPRIRMINSFSFVPNPPPKPNLNSLRSSRPHRHRNFGRSNLTPNKKQTQTQDSHKKKPNKNNQPT